MCPSHCRFVPNSSTSCSVQAVSCWRVLRLRIMSILPMCSIIFTCRIGGRGEYSQLLAISPENPTGGCHLVCPWCYRSDHCSLCLVLRNPNEMSWCLGIHLACFVALVKSVFLLHPHLSLSLSLRASKP